MHEQLYRADQVGAVDLGTFLQALAPGLQSSAPHGVTLTVEAAPVPVPLDTAVPVALMVNEFVTNALKYAYGEGTGGPVRVVLRTVGGRVELVVRDHGRGLPADFDLRRSRSLGMRIILSLAGQIDAAVVIGNADPGTECRVSFGAAVPST